jgi:hypothetical protein
MAQFYVPLEESKKMEEEEEEIETISASLILHWHDFMVPLEPSPKNFQNKGGKRAKKSEKKERKTKGKKEKRERKENTKDAKTTNVESDEDATHIINSIKQYGHQQWLRAKLENLISNKKIDASNCANPM